MDQYETLGGSASEILQPGSKSSPMVFCPALTLALGSRSGEAVANQGVEGSAFGARETDFGSLAPSMQAGWPSGLFSQFMTGSDDFLQ